MLTKKIVLKEKELIINDRYEKVLKQNNLFCSKDLKKEEKKNLMQDFELLEKDIDIIREIQRKNTGIYVKLLISKEIRQFNASTFDIRIFKKMNISVRENQMKFSDEIYGDEIIEYMQNLYDNIQISFSNQKQKKISFNSDMIKKIKYIKFHKETTAYLFHELIGHLLEEDYYNIKDNYIRKTKIYYPKVLTVAHETGPYPMSLGIGKLDDKGDRYRDSVLIKNGEIKSHIGDGNYRSSSIYEVPIPRMRTITVSSSESAKTDMCDCIIIKKILAGVVNPFDGTVNILCDDVFFNDGECLFRMDSKILISSNLKNIFENFLCLGTKMGYKTGKCIKQGQIINVGVNSPDSIFINQNIKIGVIR